MNNTWIEVGWLGTCMRIRCFEIKVVDMVWNMILVC